MRLTVARRHFFCGCGALVATGASPKRADAVSDPDVVPVDFATFHYQPFANDYVRFMNITIPAGRIATYHRHTIDFAQVYMAVSPAEGTPLGGKPLVVPRTVGEVLFNNYSKRPLVHQVANVGSGDFRVMGFEILDSKPGRFEPLARPQPYSQVMDNDRVSAWRLILQPGEAAPLALQAAPGLRIVVQGGEVVESVRDQPDHTLNLKHGDFMWQNTGAARGIRNAGTTLVELVEFELR